MKTRNWAHGTRGLTEKYGLMHLCQHEDYVFKVPEVKSRTQLTQYWRAIIKNNIHSVEQNRRKEMESIPRLRTTIKMNLELDQYLSIGNNGNTFYSILVCYPLRIETGQWVQRKRRGPIVLNACREK